MSLPSVNEQGLPLQRSPSDAELARCSPQRQRHVRHPTGFHRSWAWLHVTLILLRPPGPAAGRFDGGSRHILWCWRGTRMICTIHHRKVRAALMSSCRAPAPPAGVPISKSWRPRARMSPPRTCRGGDRIYRAEVYPEPSDHISTRQLNSTSAMTVERRFRFDCGASDTAIPAWSGSVEPRDSWLTEADAPIAAGQIRHCACGYLKLTRK